MPVRASDRVTLAVVASPTYVRTYYLLQASTATAPAAPTTNPPASPWTTTEPGYTAGSTNTLYTVQLVAYGSAAFEYGPVQQSSAYEAAKAAYNLANTANTGQAAVPRNLHGTAVPTTSSPTAPAGSVYYRHETNTSGPIIATYSRVGTAWVETPIIIRAGQVQAGAIDGIVITGATVRTSATGKRVEMIDNRLQFYDANNQDAGFIQAMEQAGGLGGLLQIGNATFGVTIGAVNLPGGGSSTFSTFSAQIDTIYADMIYPRLGTLVEFPSGIAVGGTRQPKLLGTWFTVPALGPGGIHTQTISFPAGTFSVGPHVLYSSREARYNVGLNAISATSATLIVFNVTGAAGASSRVDWLAFV